MSAKFIYAPGTVLNYIGNDLKIRILRYSISTGEYVASILKGETSHYGVGETVFLYHKQVNSNYTIQKSINYNQYWAQLNE